MIATLLLFTLLIPMILGFGVALLGRPGTSGWRWLGGLVALAGAATLWLIDGVPTLPPVSAKHKVLVLAALVVPLAAVVQTKLKTAVQRAGCFLALLLAALVWIGWPRLADPTLLTRFAALAVFLAVTAFSLSRLDRLQGSGFAGPAALLATQIGLALIAILGAHIGGGQLGGALAAMTGGILILRYGTLVLGRAAELVMDDTSLWAGFALTGLVLIQSGLFAPTISSVAVALLSLPLLVATIWPGPFSRRRLLAPILSGAASALPAAVAVAVAVL